jgi:hypothetical protein
MCESKGVKRLSVSKGNSKTHKTQKQLRGRAFFQLRFWSFLDKGNSKTRLKKSAAVVPQVTSQPRKKYVRVGANIRLEAEIKKSCLPWAHAQGGDPAPVGDPLGRLPHRLGVYQGHLYPV